MAIQTELTEQVSLSNGLDGVTAAERYLTRLARKSFLSLWSYPNIHRDESLLKKRGTKCEICDLLVVFENHILIFSDKDCAFQDKGNLDIDWSRWYRGAVFENAKQVWGAEKWIKEHPDNIFLDKDCTRPFPISLPLKNVVRIHRIAVAHSASVRCQRELGGSGSLMVMPKIIGDQHCRKRSEGGVPFAIGHVDPDKGYVHVFDDTTLDVMLTTLDTISDFVAYLDKKEQFIMSGKLLSAAGEEDLLAIYLKDINDQEEHDFVVDPSFHAITIGEGFWDNFANSPQRKAQLEANEISYSWDRLIETFLHHIYAGTSYYQSHPGLANQERVFRLLAREPRTRRRMLAGSLLKFIFSVPATQRSTRTVLPSRLGDPHYVFLVLPRLNGITEEAYREARRRHLEQCCFITKINCPDAVDIIGIATESGRKEAGSEDVLYLDAHEWTPIQQTEAERLKSELMEHGIIGESVWHKSSEKEYPDVPVSLEQRQPAKSHLVMKGRDRNALCPCGSRKKYKKCHGA